MLASDLVPPRRQRMLSVLCLKRVLPELWDMKALTISTLDSRFVRILPVEIYVIKDGSLYFALLVLLI